MITIRKSTAADIARVLDIFRRAVDATHGFLSATHRRDIDREVAAVLPAVPLDLAVDEHDRPLGFMLLTTVRDEAGRAVEGYVQALFVDPDHHGSGIGRTLVEDAIRRCSGLIATDVNEHNVQAMGFWERMSFYRYDRSATDGAGRPYPLIHMRFRPPRPEQPTRP